MKRAAFLLPSDRMGGAERVVRTLAREAARSEHYDEVHVFVLCWTRTGTLDDLAANERVKLHYTHAATEARGVFGLMKFLVSRRFNLVFSSSTHLNAFCSLLRKLRLLRTRLLVARESTVIFDRSFGRRGWIFRSLYRLYGAQDLIICQTRRMLESLDRNTGGKFRASLVTMGNPLDVERGDRNIQATNIEQLLHSRHRLVWCGRLEPVKAPLRAVAVLKELESLDSGHWHLAIIGDGRMRDKIEQEVRGSDLEDRVTLAGLQSNPMSLMSVCQFGLLTSDTEGFPNVILEMLGSGVRRVVTTDCAGELDEIPGVTVVERGPDLERRMARRLFDARMQLPDSRVESFLADRSPSTFFERMLKLANNPSTPITG